MIKILYIAFGGGAGASLRYLLNESLKEPYIFFPASWDYGG